MSFYSVKHSFNAGDLLASIPGFLKLYEETGKRVRIYQVLDFPSFFYYDAPVATANENGQGVCMNKVLFEKLKPLLEAQEYIESFEVWEGQKVDYDMDETRFDKNIPMPSGEIHNWTFSVFPELSCDLSKQWLKVHPISLCKTSNGIVQLNEKVIINRTERYTNPYISYHFLKEYEDKIIFAGSEREWDVFNKTWKLNLPFLLTDDFLELARIIYCAKGFLGNQSSNFHVADSLKAKRILELCPQFPNTFPTGANGHAFYRQKSLEYYMRQLIKMED